MGCHLTALFCRAPMNRLKSPARLTPKLPPPPACARESRSSQEPETRPPAPSATGITKPGAMSCTIGTSGVVFAYQSQPSYDEAGRVHTFCHAVPKAWHVMGVTQGAGLSLQWFRNRFSPETEYDDLTADATRSPAGAHGLFWLPYLMGERHATSRMPAHAAPGLALPPGISVPTLFAPSSKACVSARRTAWKLSTNLARRLNSSACPAAVWQEPVLASTLHRYL